MGRMFGLIQGGSGHYLCSRTAGGGVGVGVESSGLGVGVGAGVASSPCRRVDIRNRSLRRSDSRLPRRVSSVVWIAPAPDEEGWGC
jgi:hypothetical protein